MTESKTTARSKIPGVGDMPMVGKAFRQEGDKSVKSELVILLKATVVQGTESWSKDMLAAQHRLEDMNPSWSDSSGGQ